MRSPSWHARLQNTRRSRKRKNQASGKEKLFSRRLGAGVVGEGRKRSVYLKDKYTVTYNVV